MDYHRNVNSLRNDADYSRRLLIVWLAVALSTVLGVGGVYWWRNQAQQREAQHRVAEAERRSVEVNAQARDLLEKGEFAAGLSVVDSILDLVEMPDLLETKYYLLYNSNRRNEAYQVMLKLLKRRPNEAPYQHTTGVLALNLSKPKEAAAHFESAVKLEPQNSNYQIEWANLCLMNGDLEKGRTILKKLVEQNPQCEECWFNYASAYGDHGALERAIEIFRQAADEFPNNFTHQYHLALALDAKNRQSKDQPALDEAVVHYQRSLELHPLRNSVAAQRIFEITGKAVPAELEALVADEVPLEVEGDLSYVRARINGVEGRFLLDTGASYVCVYSNAASHFKLIAADRMVETKTANGIIQVRVAYGQLQLGKQKLSDAVVCFLPEIKDDGNAGLFGVQFLQKFGAQIDVAHQRLVLNSDR